MESHIRAKMGINEVRDWRGRNGGRIEGIRKGAGSDKELMCRGYDIRIEVKTCL